MKKILVLILGISFTATSCNFLTDSLGFASGEKGVFVSDDAGRSFKPANLIGRKDSLGGTSANTLVFDPRNPETIYFGSGLGVHKTDNGAENWTHILAGMAVSDLAIDPFKSDVIYAVGISGSNGKIIRSNDGGTSWIDIYTEPTSSNAVTSLAVVTYNPLILVAALASGEVIRSTDEGATWQAAADLQDRTLRLRASGNSLYLLTRTKGLYKSSDEGRNFRQLTALLVNTSLTDFSSGISSISEFFDLALDPRQSGVVYLGTQQGLIRTVNDGQSWTFINMPLKNTLLKVSSVAVHPSNSNNIFATVASTMFKSLNGGVTWETRELPTQQETRVILIHPQSSNIIYLGLGNKK